MSGKKPEGVYTSTALVVSVGAQEDIWIINRLTGSNCLLVVKPTTDGGFRCTTKWAQYEMPTDPNETTFQCLAQEPLRTVDVTNHTERRWRSRESRLNARHPVNIPIRQYPNRIA